MVGSLGKVVLVVHIGCWLSWEPNEQSSNVGHATGYQVSLQYVEHEVHHAQREGFVQAVGLSICQQTFHDNEPRP